MGKKGTFSLWGATCRAAMRRRLASVLMILLAAVSTFSAIALQHLIARQQQSLDRTIAETAISCVVTDIKGIASNGLNMFSSYVDRLTGRIGEQRKDEDLSGYVKDVNALAHIPIAAPADTGLRKILSLRSDPELDPLTGAQVTFLDGWDEGVFQTEELVCLLSGTFPTRTGDDGAEYITVAYSDYEQGQRPMELRVVGYVTNGPQQVIYCPFYQPMRSDNVSEAFLVDTCSFTIRDNTRLEESKQAIYDLELFGPPKLSNQENGLEKGVLVQDEIFVKTVGEIRANLATLHKLLPILLILCTGISFFAGFLATRGRMKEFAVMRCMGMSKWRVFLLVVGELFGLSVIGGLIGFAAGWIAEGTLDVRSVYSAVSMIGVLLLGAAAAALRIAGINPMKLMKVED